MLDTNPEQILTTLIALTQDAKTLRHESTAAYNRVLTTPNIGPKEWRTREKGPKKYKKGNSRTVALLPKKKTRRKE